MIMIAGFRWLTAAGNASLITQAKDQITSALIGLLIGIGSYALLNVINPQLVSLRSLEIGRVGEGEGISFETCEDKEYGDSCVKDEINGYCSKNKACIPCAEEGTPCGASGTVPAYACPNEQGVCGKDNGCRLNIHGFQVCAY